MGGGFGDTAKCKIQFTGPCFPLMLRQKGYHFEKDIVKCIFLNGNFVFLGLSSKRPKQIILFFCNCIKADNIWFENCYNIHLQFDYKLEAEFCMQHANNKINSARYSPSDSPYNSFRGKLWLSFSSSSEEIESMPDIKNALLEIISTVQHNGFNQAIIHASSIYLLVNIYNIDNRHKYEILVI